MSKHLIAEIMDLQEKLEKITTPIAGELEKYKIDNTALSEKLEHEALHRRRGAVELERTSQELEKLRETYPGVDEHGILVDKNTAAVKSMREELFRARETIGQADKRAAHFRDESETYKKLLVSKTKQYEQTNWKLKLCRATLKKFEKEQGEKAKKLTTLPKKQTRKKK